MDEFREWLSDNLRYIALILGVLVIGAGLFFGVKAVKRSFNNQQTENVATDSAVDSVEVTQEAESTKPTPAVAVEAVELITEDGQLTEDAQTAVKSIINTYYEALNAHDTEFAKKVTDSLSDEDIATIENSQTVYSEINTIPRSGISGDGKTAVAFVDYKYQNSDQAIPHAGLSWLYLQYNEGNYKVVVKASEDPTIQTYVQSLTEDPEIAAIIQKVQAEAEAANAAETGVESGTVNETAENTEATEGTEAAVQPEETTAQTEGETAGQAEADAAAQAEADAAAAAAQAEADAAAQAEGEATSDNISAGTTAVILETCNVRKGAGYEFEVITVVEQGSTVTVLDDEGQGWIHVQTENGEGYIGRKFINAQ